MTPALSPQYWFFRGDKGYAVCNLISESGTRILVVFNGTEGGGGTLYLQFVIFSKVEISYKSQIRKIYKDNCL